MHSLADRVILASGWTRRLLALVAGAVGALAMAPVDVGPALIVPMVAAVWLLDGSSEGRADGRRGLWMGWGSLRLAFEAGWWLGFGYFLAGLWWLGAAFLVEPEFAWALPFGVVGLPALLAFFPALGFAAARLLWVPGAGRLFALALGLGLSEWLRGTVLTGFPWNAWGMALGGTLVTAQAAALVGLDGLTMIADRALRGARDADRCAGGRLAWTPRSSRWSRARLWWASVPRGWRLPAPGTVPPASWFASCSPAFSRTRSSGRRTGTRSSPATSNCRGARMRPRASKLADVTLLVWPESAFPFILTRDPEALAPSATSLPPRRRHGHGRRAPGGRAGRRRRTRPHRLLQCHRGDRSRRHPARQLRQGSPRTLR